MGRFVLSLLCIWYLQTVSSQDMTTAQKLGYPPETKLLIIHADDLGVSHSENQASIEALESGPVNSASIMVPCPWFPEIANYARNNQHLDFGLHLTLNSEWDYFKWGPVSSRDSVPSLVNKHGYFFSSVDSVTQLAEPSEAYIEMRNQISKAYRAGIDVTHLDAHMGTAVSSPELTEAYLKLSKEFALPVLLDPRIYELDHSAIEKLIDSTTVVADRILTATPKDYNSGMKEFYIDLLRNLESGLNCLLIHLAYDNEEMQAITVNHPDWGSAWRQADFDFFISPACQKILNEEKIVLISWRELRDRITRAP